MSIDLTPIIKALIALLATIITCYVIPWIKAKTTRQQRENMQAIIRALVYAAEQLYGAGNGSLKLEYVIDKLRAMGYDVDRSEIEAEVYQAFNAMTPILLPETGETTERPSDASSGADAPADIVDGVDVEITHWPLEQLKAFCEDNGVPHEGAQTREDYIAAIEKWASAKPPDDPPAAG